MSLHSRYYQLWNVIPAIIVYFLNEICNSQDQLIISDRQFNLHFYMRKNNSKFPIHLPLGRDVTANFNYFHSFIQLFIP
jgi:hypothetical protein